MKMNTAFSALIITLIFPALLRGQTTTIKNLQGEEINSEELEEFISIAMEDFEIPGLAVAIVNDGKVVYHTTRGMADIAGKQAVDKTTIFEGASLSKPMFAHFVMTFVEEGKLDLDTPLFHYLPYSDIAHDDRYKSITARMALSHTTGFPNWRTDYPEKQLFIQFDPGTAWHYSGEGYQYLAKVLAHLADTDAKGLESLFQRRIGQPLKLLHTRFIQDETNFKHKAKPYKEGKAVDSGFTNEAFGAAYGIHTEALDFAQWMIGVMEGKVLQEQSYQALFANQVQLPENSENAQAGIKYWTLGFAKFNSPFGALYTHGGNNYGFTSGFGLHREQKWGVVYFTNANQVSEFGLELFAFLHE